MDVCRLFRRVIAGQSVENRPIELFVFDGPDPAAPWDTLFIGVFHGDEGISGRLLTAFIEDIENNAAFQAENKKPFAVLPVLNPDGLVRLSARDLQVLRLMALGATNPSAF